MLALRSSRPSRRLTASLIAAGLAACGDGGLTGPFVPPELAGQWAWRVTGATGSGVSCDVTGVTLTFTGPNTALTGSFVAAGGQNVACIVAGQNTFTSFTGTTVLTALSLTGAAITFSFTATSGLWVSTGNVTGADTMGGTATIRLTASGTTYELTGPWTATRL